MVIVQLISDTYERFLEEAMDPQNAEPRQIPASEDEVKRLPTEKLNGGTSAIGRMCSVCRDDFVIGDIYTTMKCGHGYHRKCLRPWLSLQNTCPECRYPLLTTDGKYNKLVIEFRQELRRQRAALKMKRQQGNHPLESTFANNSRLTRIQGSIIPLENRTLHMSISLQTVVHNPQYRRRT